MPNESSSPALRSATFPVVCGPPVTICYASGVKRHLLAQVFSAIGALLDEKKMDVLQKWFQSKIPTYYIMIDSEFKNCANISKWQKNATTASN
jgi:hypothetical protein